MTELRNVSPSNLNDATNDAEETDARKEQSSLESNGSDPLMQDLLRNMRAQSMDETRRRELGQRLV